jgi:hypothetical protein
MTAEGEPADPEPFIDAHRGFLVVHFTGDVGDGPMVFVPALGAGAGSIVTVRVAGSEDAEPVTVAGGGEPVPLAPPESRPTNP